MSHFFYRRNFHLSASPINPGGYVKPVNHNSRMDGFRLDYTILSMGNCNFVLFTICLPFLCNLAAVRNIVAAAELERQLSYAHAQHHHHRLPALLQSGPVTTPTTFPLSHTHPRLAFPLSTKQWIFYIYVEIPSTWQLPFQCCCCVFIWFRIASQFMNGGRYTGKLFIKDWAYRICME